MNVVLISCLFIFSLIIILFFVFNKKNKKEDEVSILDVMEDGVPNSSELGDFSYGYEKEETTIIEPVNEKNGVDE